MDPSQLPEAAELAEMTPPSEGGRVFERAIRPGLADCAPSGRVRLDGLARWFQDIAFADVEDAGVADAAVWVVRRNRIRVERFPRFGDHLIVRTFCSGIGRMWAERRTSVLDAEGGESLAEGVALWVHLDPVGRRPTRLTEQEIAVYGGTGSDRRVSARLRHPAPPDRVAGSARWRFRATDCDLADHVNNAAYWEPLEEQLLAGSEPRRIDVEIEFRGPAQPGSKEFVSSGHRRWIVGGGETHASFLLNFLEPGSTAG